MRSKSSVRLITAVACGALLVTMAPALGLSEPAVLAAPMAEESQEKVTERPDRVSAMVAARTQKSRVEDLSQRTSTTATYANPNGTWTVESLAGIVRSKADDDKWVPIDTTVEDAGKAFEPKATPVDAEYSDGGDKTVGSVASAAGSSVEVGWPTTLPAPVAEGDLLTYPGAVPGGDLVVRSRSDGFSYSVVLEEAPAANADPLEYRIPLKFDGVTAVEREDGSVILRDGGERVGVMTPPVMWDEANQGADGERHPVTATVEGEGDSRTLVLKPDMDFLRDPATTYPVTVDPQFSLSAAGDTYVDSSSSSDKSGSAELRVGSNNLGLTKTRTYLSFDLSSMSAQTGTADSAELKLTNFQTGACAGTAVRMSRTTSAFSIPTVTWASQPSTTTTGSTTTTDGYGGGSCPGEGVMVWDATQVVNDARAASSTLGLQIKGESETSVSGWRKFRSLENGDANKYPKLVVTFNKTPNTPTGLTVSPGNPGYSTSTTPTFSAVVTDPDAAANRGYFEVKSGSTLVWSGTSDWATSGARVEVTVPSGNLTNGNTYTVHAYSEDDLVKSTTAATSTFTVDTTAPTATLTATGYPNNTWSDPSSNTFTFQGSSDTKTFETTYDGVPNTLTANGSAQYVWNSGPWPLTGGWHVWEATAVDQAGNRGPTTTLNYGTGTPGFTLPQHNARSTSTFPVDISAPPGASSVTLRWKPSSGGSWNTVTEATKDGTAWSGAVTTIGGRSTTEQLLWNATAEPHGTGTLEAPAVISLNACFHYPSAADKCTSSYQHTVQLVPSAFGGNFPTADLGPATVALFTGEASISGIDAADTDTGLSRAFTSFDDATLSSGAFGPGWSDPGVLSSNSDTTSTIIDNRAKDGSIVIVGQDSGSQTFVPNSGSTTGFEPLRPTGDATALTFTPGTGGTPDKLELLRPLGGGSIKTSWTLKVPEGGGDPEWTADEVDAPGTASDLVITSDHERPTFVRESEAAAAATCTATTQTVGCHALKITYSGSGVSARVTSVSRVIGAASQANVLVKELGSYTYDGSGRLASACTAVPAVGKPRLCVTYTYTIVAGRTLLSEAQPPGQKKWRFYYDGTGRLSSVKRELPSGSDATWSVDYGLTPTSSGLPDLSSSAVSQWGQQTIPTGVVAVYQPYTGTASVSKADLYYTTNDGTTTNFASYGPSGWLVDTSWLDANGNEVRHLDATGWARVQAAPVADRPRVASEASSYTLYNDWGGEDLAGTRVVDEYGPARTATLANGTTGLFRTHTHIMYDDAPDVDASLIDTRPVTYGLGLAVKTVASASDVGRTTDYDSLVTKFGYAPVVSGDGSGWLLGSPTTTATQVGSNDWAISTTRWDSSGRQVESRQPGGASDASGAGSDAHATATTYYTASGSGDCGGKPEWDGLVCKVGPAGQPPEPTIPSRYTSSYNYALQPATVQEISGGIVTRTETSDYDEIGRLTSSQIATAGSGVTNETMATTYGYDETSGLMTTTSSGGTTITTGYDSWGRTNAYTDAVGTSSTSTFDALGNTATFNDGVATYTYTHDEFGRLLSIDAGGVGTFSYSYASDGRVDSVTYPNGVVATSSFDELGTRTGLTYAQGSTELLAFSTSFRPGGRAATQASTASSQSFTYDNLGRLSSAQDLRSGACTTRIYGFDGSSNRTSFASYAPGSGGACQSATPSTSRTNTFDSAGRLRNTGYTYDTLGRTLTIPQVDAGGSAAGELSATYHANDMVASLSQSVLNGSGVAEAKVTSYTLDPAQRVSTIVTTTNGTESARLRNRYTGSLDSPSAVDSSNDGGTTWSTTRYVGVPGLGMTASSVGGVATVHLANLHGDVVATMANSAGASVIGNYSEYDEYGNSLGPSTRRFGWLGTSRRSTDALGGVILMGARLYNPATGSFASVDPVAGGNVTAYTYPQDPVGESDISGRSSTGFAAVYGACLERLHRWYEHAMCGAIVEYSFQIAVASEKLDTGLQQREAARHYAWMIYLCWRVDCGFAKALGDAHERGVPRDRMLDSRRDQANNEYSRGWYYRHGCGSLARSHLGHVYSYGDMWWWLNHGVDLFRRGYLYKVLRGYVVRSGVN